MRYLSSVCIIINYFLPFVKGIKESYCKKWVKSIKTASFYGILAWRFAKKRAGERKCKNEGKGLLCRLTKGKK